MQFNYKKIFLLIYNNNGNKDATTSETVHIKINNVGYAESSPVQVCRWIADGDHGNFWNQWHQAQIQNGLTDADFYWSRYSVGNMSNRALSLWHENEMQYQNLSMLDSTISQTLIENNYPRLFNRKNF